MSQATAFSNRTGLVEHADFLRLDIPRKLDPETRVQLGQFIMMDQTMRNKLSLRIFPEGTPKEECSAYQVLFKLISEGHLRSYSIHETQNCYKAALSLIKDLVRAGFDTNGWQYVIGDCNKGQGEHAWLEYDGWTVDFSNGKQLIATWGEFERVKEPENVRRYTVAEVEEMKQTARGRSLLGYAE